VKRISLIIICIVFLCLNTGAEVASDDKIGLSKTQEIVIKIPRKLLTYDKPSISTGLPIFFTFASMVGEEVAVYRATDWQMKGWPLMTTFYFEKSSKKKEYTEIEFRSNLAYLKLRFAPETADVNAALRHLVFVGSVGTFESDQKLVDGSFVLVDGNRIEVDLSKAAQI